MSVAARNNVKDIILAATEMQPDSDSCVKTIPTKVKCTVQIRPIQIQTQLPEIFHIERNINNKTQANVKLF